MKQIKVTLNRKGVSVEVDGVTGPACDEIIKEILDQIGGSVISSQEKPEYYEQEQQNDLQFKTDYSGS